MAVRTILHYPEPVLKKISKPVVHFDEALKQLAADMVETMYDAPGVGLAAPQVGVLQRVIVMDCSGKENPPDLIVAVNPVLVETEGESCEEEGCLSVPEYYAVVKRFSRVTMNYQDVDGNPRQRQAEDLLAVAMQHEIDHLQGILFVDHLSPLKRSIFRKKYQKLMQQRDEE
ncbi:peptide deformylase [Geopsychrobacter electrodiphilus]|uniref:peptide deformylase n=1 Tax=Geopsychrobacter electrodiphilus TaxID=225196 RepID=UPI000372290A|nr:peptide deformylase [Geopsychrobacter electrodiphilus]